MVKSKIYKDITPDSNITVTLFMHCQDFNVCMCNAIKYLQR